MKKLLIIAPYQFGELSDCYYWAKYAVKEGWNVSYLGYRYKERMIKERSCPGVRIIGVRHFASRFIHGTYFLLRIILEILLNRHENVIVCRFPHCEIIPKIFKTRNIILDVRTLSVSKNETEREIADSKLREIIKCFPKCSVISEGVGSKLSGCISILPLGAEPISVKNKSFREMRLFYIGTFNNRDLDVFIEGLAKFQKITSINCTFDIIGGGTKEEEKKVVDAVKRLGVENVTLHGYMTHEEAVPLFEKCNIGVCYVPMTEYYDFQPPTKLYEYLLSGMACIVTRTSSNMEVMDDYILGVSVYDNVNSVCDGLIKLERNLNNYDSNLIRKATRMYHWHEIVTNSFLPLFR